MTSIKVATILAAFLALAACEKPMSKAMSHEGDGMMMKDDGMMKDGDHMMQSGS